MAKKKTKTQTLIELARHQFKRCCIPTATAVVVSVLISKLGLPLVPLALMGAAGVAYTKGYRLCVIRPEKKPKAPDTAE